MVAMYGVGGGGGDFYCWRGVVCVSFPYLCAGDVMVVAMIAMVMQ